jgi:hypothetical protein
VLCAALMVFASDAAVQCSGVSRLFVHCHQNHRVKVSSGPNFVCCHVVKIAKEISTGLDGIENKVYSAFVHMKEIEQ